MSQCKSCCKVRLCAFVKEQNEINQSFSGLHIYRSEQLGLFFSDFSAFLLVCVCGGGAPQAALHPFNLFSIQLEERVQDRFIVI